MMFDRLWSNGSCFAQKLPSVEKRDSQRGLNHLNHLLGQRYEGDVVLVREELQLEEDGARGQRHDDHLSVVLYCALIMPFEANSA